MMNCPICGQPSYFFVSKKDRFGQEYHYLKCSGCRFLFDQDLVLDKKVLEAKTSKVYDQDYFTSIDSGWKLRGDKMVSVVNSFLKIFTFLGRKKGVTVLDYGAGNGYVTSLIRTNGQVLYYDKYEKPTYQGNYTVLKKPGEANLICAVELVEHLSDIREWDAVMKSALNALILTTEVSDGIRDSELPNWVYVNPDAGHTSIYSFRALSLLARKYGFFYFFFPYKSSHIFIKNKFFSKLNFVKLEYAVYAFLRRIRNFFK